MSTRITTPRGPAWPATIAIVLALTGAACGGSEPTSPSSAAPATSTPTSSSPTTAAATRSKYPGTSDGAKALLAEFAKPGADLSSLSKQLEPTMADYDDVFDATLSEKARSMYGPAWESGKMVVQPKPGQTEVKLVSATTDELKSWSGGAEDFPGGYKTAAPHFKSGLTIYKFSFVEPGEELGMAYDGLVYVNDNWRIFPKPYRQVSRIASVP